MDEQKRKNALKRRVRRLAAVTLVSLVVAACSLMLLLLSYLHQHKVEEDRIEREETEVADAGTGAVTYTQAEVDELLAKMESDTQLSGRTVLLNEMRSSLENGTSALNLLRSLYPDQVVYVDDNRYHFHDIREDWTKNPYQEDLFKLDDNGFMSYPVEGTESKHLGVDVSRFQGKIDWAQVKEAGVEYAIIRVGMRGYESGKIVVDEQAAANLQGCADNGIPCGVYFFSEAINEEEAMEEVQTVLEQIQGYPISLPVYIDIEQVTSSSNRAKDLTPQQRTAVAKVFLEAIRDAGYTPGIYGNLKSFLVLLDLSELQQYTKWFACYNTPIYYPYDYSILQYSEKGVIPGIPEKVDLNIALDRSVIPAQ